MKQNVDRYNQLTEKQKRDAQEAMLSNPHFQKLSHEVGYEASWRPMAFVQVERALYDAEVGKKDGHYIYHFFPKHELVKRTSDDGEEYLDKVYFAWPKDFEDKMGDAFLGVFKIPERLEAGFVPELNSWSVRARHFAENPLADELAVRIFDELDKLL